MNRRAFNIGATATLITGALPLPAAAMNWYDIAPCVTGRSRYSEIVKLLRCEFPRQSNAGFDFCFPVAINGRIFVPRDGDIESIKCHARRKGKAQAEFVELIHFRNYDTDCVYAMFAST